ncbi:MAG TPA: 4-hydroxythreonine-4-phosphate dehydrogenase PdxA [Planctomycetota bacterium]|nr:4-hydroxythreonine-4-phosphate dehydrogenase PdxA [Planctomycetota bacterium]
MSAAHTRPRLAVTVGDPAGIGPEVVLAALGDAGVRAAARLVVIGPAALRPADLPAVPRAELERAPDAAWLESEGPARWELGRVAPECGAAALAALRAGHELALAGQVDGLVTAPVSKAALRAAGEVCEGQTELLGRWSGVERFEMVAIAGALRVMLLTRHLPLVEALSMVTTERVLDRLRLFDGALRRLGFERPRLALAGLNPHAGEGGLIGREDVERLVPAVAAARAEGLDVSGPHSPDAVFLAAREGRHDGVLALYHDQAFIPVKLVAEGRGLTWIAGLPYLRVSPAHGTAFDIAGTGRASPRNLVAALLQAAAWAGKAGLGSPGGPSSVPQAPRHGLH